MIRFEPHAHSEYSNIRLIDSINKIPALIDRAIEIGLKGIALTDHECVAGAVKVVKYYQEIKESHPDFKVALGNEIYLTNTRDKNQRYYHFILIAKDKIGWKQLRILSSKAWLNSYWDRGVERVPTLKKDLYEIVSKDPGHLIGTSACIGGELSSAVLEMETMRRLGNEQGAAAAYNQINEFLSFIIKVFGKDDFYIECAPGQSKEQIIVNKKLAEIASVFGLKMIIGTDAHYLKKEDRFIHKAYLNSKQGEREVDDFYEYSYLQTEEQIKENLKLSIVDSYELMCKNSIEIYDKIEEYNIQHNQTIPKVEVKDYPKTSWIIVNNVGEDNYNYPVLSSMLKSDDKYERYWVNECLNQLYAKGILDSEQGITYLSRLEEEADIKKTISEKLGTNMFSYPITLAHYVDLFWECGSLVGAGRGSSCSGLNHYLLGITQLDPIQWGLPFWRYLNKERVELGDIDLDLAPSKRPMILRKIKDERGKNFISELDDESRENLGCTLIATFGTEGTKNAILTACRGYRSEEYPDGIDNDEGQYIASLVPSERGFLWSLDDVMFGNPEKDRRAVVSFRNEIEQYPGLFEIIKGIDGLINKRSSHASGVILFDEDPYEFGAFMKTPKGEVITQFDLHDAEYLGMTKYDFLVTEVQDKLGQAIQFLQEDGKIEKDLSLREVYNKYFHPNVLPLDDEKVWKAIQEGKVINVFQFDSEVGSQAAKKIKPTNILELTDSNGLMRLMTAEKGEETPMEKYIRYKNNISLWYDEMREAGLTDQEVEYVKPYFESSFGVPPSQEQLMRMLMDEHICNFSLAEANTARKVVGKKQMSKIPELHQKILNQASSEALGKYIWKCGVGPQMGYSFSIIHALAYSFIGFQTAYIATNWNPIYWDTACLVVNSGSLEEDNNEVDEDGVPTNTREAGADYGKIAKALGEIIGAGIKVSLVDINKSAYGFRPDVDNNQILFGMKALGSVNSEIIEQIKKNRPYKTFKEFMLKVPLGKKAMISLIKAGAFDELEKEWAAAINVEPRKLVMAEYLAKTSEPKKRLTLQNFNGLLEQKLVPNNLTYQARSFAFNKYLKKHKYQDYYCMNLNSKDLDFYADLYDNEGLEMIDGVPCIKQKIWDNMYKSIMDEAREWLKDNQEEVLRQYNTILFKQEWNKYAEGTISAWEMEAICFYYHEHELINLNTSKYGIVDFKTKSTEPEIANFFKRNGKQIPLYKLERIAGTVISKDDTRHSIVLLTTTGTVNVKFTKENYAWFNRQLSEVGEDGKKHVVEYGWFKRGTKLIVTGYRRDDTWVCKNYKTNGGHHLYKINSIDEKGNIEVVYERA